MLPCMSRLVTRMGAGGDGGAALLPPEDFPGLHRCWPEVLLFGPLGQVGELVSAAGRRLRLAAEELRRAAAVGDRAGGRGGRSVGFLGKVARGASKFTADRLVQGLWQGFFEVPEPSGAGGEAQEGAATAAAALRVSYAACELLPVMCRTVLVCTELGLGKGEGAREGGDADEKLVNLANAIRCAAVALDYALLLLTRHSWEAAAAAAERQGGQAGGDGSSAGAAEGRGVGGARDGCASWRQLLLRDMRLMEVLGAAVQLQASGAGQCQVLTHNGRPAHAPDVLGDNLAFTLSLAAATFPAEFRAAAGGADAAAATGAATGPTAGGSCAPPCISIEDACGVLEMDDGDNVVSHVLRGLDPTPRDVWELACDQWSQRGVQQGAPLEARLRLLVPPAEAREAVAAAGAAARASG